MSFIRSFVATLVIYLAIDLVWVGLVAKNFYNQQLAPFNRTLNLPAALLSYLLIIIGIVVFVLPGVTRVGFSGFLKGALFGLIAYGVYDLVNLATLADWSLKMTVIDMAWGAAVCGVVTLLVTLVLT